MAKRRNLSGIFFRAERDGKWENVVFEELTEDEQKLQMVGKNSQWLQSLAIQLARSIQKIGEMCDIVTEEL